MSDQARRIAGEYEKGVSLQALASRYGLSRDAVIRMLRDQGVTLRSTDAQG